MNSQATNVMFESYKLGDVTLSNRFVMASLTRIRADPKTGVANDLHIQYYSQRASAGLIITECSPIANNGNSFLGAAGIYTPEQVEGWKKVVDAVHAKGGKIFLQIWHAGRAASPTQTGETSIAPSAIAIRGNLRRDLPHAIPKEMTKEDIQLVLEQFRQGALNAKEAGFDGIELHGANGYLVDQFIRDGSNQRTDEYGGSIENRLRFPLQALDTLIQVFGAGRVGMKLTPVGRFQDMYDSDPVATYTYLLKELDKRKIAYVQMMEPGENYGWEEVQHYPLGEKQIANVGKTFRPYFNGALIINNNLTAETASQAIINGTADLASFGKLFIANPDFVERVRNSWSFNKLDASTFYVGGEKGYTDYPFYEVKVENS